MHVVDIRNHHVRRKSGRKLNIKLVVNVYGVTGFINAGIDCGLWKKLSGSYFDLT